MLVWVEVTQKLPLKKSSCQNTDFTSWTLFNDRHRALQENKKHIKTVCYRPYAKVGMILAIGPP